MRLQRRAFLQGVLATATLAWAPLRAAKLDIWEEPSSILEDIMAAKEQLYEDTGLVPTELIVGEGAYAQLGGPDTFGGMRVRMYPRREDSDHFEIRAVEHGYHLDTVHFARRYGNDD